MQTRLSSLVALALAVSCGGVVVQGSKTSDASVAIEPDNGITGGNGGAAGVFGASAGASGTGGAIGGKGGAAPYGSSGSAGTAPYGSSGSAGAALDGGGSADAAPDVGVRRDGGMAAACTTTSENGMALDAVSFCTYLLMTCGGVNITDAYNTQAKCEAAYDVSTKKACQSYHLCGNAYMKSTAQRTTHCPHAVGAGPCAP